MVQPTAQRPGTSDGRALGRWPVSFECASVARTDAAEIRVVAPTVVLAPRHSGLAVVDRDAAEAAGPAGLVQLVSTVTEVKSTPFGMPICAPGDGTFWNETLVTVQPLPDNALAQG